MPARDQRRTDEEAPLLGDSSQAHSQSQRIYHGAQPEPASARLENSSSFRSSSRTSTSEHASDDRIKVIDFEDDDPDYPRNWAHRRKMGNVAVIAIMALLSPLASSMFTPGIQQIAEDLGSTEQDVIGATTAFVVTLGLGPLVLKLYLVCYALFALAQIPTAAAPNVAVLIAARTVAGFFGSVGIANGGGTISDMFHPSERSQVFGWYLLGPLLGPTLGPLFGGVVVEKLGWRWIFWLLLILCCVVTALGLLFLEESYAPVLLSRRCEKLGLEDSHTKYTFTGADDSPLPQKLKRSMTRPLRILFTQPIVITMAAYQAVIFATMYTLFTQLQDIFARPPYNMSSTMVGLLYLGPGLGFLTAVWFIVPHVDTIYNKMTARNQGKAKPEFRLPLANIGAVLLPITLAWFAWAVELKTHWFVIVLPTFFFGLGQVAIFNTVQNYYIDAFERYAASAIAGGALMRSLVGGVVPLAAPALFDNLGYGWGWTVFAALTLLLAPSPLLFMRYGERIRHRFAIQL